VTRGYLSSVTGLSRSAVAEGVQDLLPAGLVVEQRGDGRGPSSARGRPSALLVPAAPDGSVVGIDVGHTHVAVAVARTDGRVLAERRELLDVDDSSGTALDSAAQLVHDLLAEGGIAKADVLGVAAGVPCPLEPTSGRTRPLGDHPTWADLDTSEELARRIGRPVHVDNDAEMGAYGERRFGAARGCRDFVYVKASHGIGAGLVLNGEVYRGATGAAGEIGHVQLPGAHGVCSCGNRGCLETVISITEVHRQLAELRLPGLPPSTDGSLTAISANPVAARIITESGRVLGRVLADLCNCLNPAAIILGGELATAGQPLLSGVQESVRRHAVAPTTHAVDIRIAQLGLRSELMGAVSQAIQHSLARA
jgi:predicted NBD/HSP70 family sugar kinase